MKAIFLNFTRTIYFANEQELKNFKEKAIADGVIRFED